MKHLIKKILSESLKYYHVDDATKDKYQMYTENVSNVKRIAVFDFDNTLVRTPERKDYRKITGDKWPHVSWWEHPGSLDMEFFDMPIINKVVKDLDKEHSNPDTLVVLLTGRVNTLDKQVKEVLNHHDLVFDRYYLKPEGQDSLVHKLSILNSLLDEFDEIEELEMWDDRAEHKPYFIEWGESLDYIDFKFNFIT